MQISNKINDRFFFAKCKLNLSAHMVFIFNALAYAHAYIVFK